MTDSKQTISRQLLEQLLPDLEADSPRKAAGLADDVVLDERTLLIITIEHTLKVAQEKNWPLVSFEQGLYIYTGEYWVIVSDDAIRDFLGKAAERIKIDPFIARHFRFRENLLKQFFSSAYFQPPQPPQDQVLINLRNGTFVFDRGKFYLKPFDRNDFLRYQLPFAYDPTAEAKRFIEYLNRVVSIEKQKILSEYSGYLFIKSSQLKLEKVLLLYGSGSNGKSVFFDCIMKLLGPENITNFSLQSLTDNTGYTRASISGKLLNYSSEISSKLDVTKFKLLASGEPIECRQIYGKPFILADYCKFIFNCNNLPKDLELNDAFFRRFLIIHFDQTISPEERDVELSSYLTANEMSGIFNWVLLGLVRLLNQQGFTRCTEVDMFIENFRKESDSVQIFLEEARYQVSSAGYVFLKDLYEEYKFFCRDNFYPLISNRAFAERLRSSGIKVHRISSGNVVFVNKV
ncbi:MAG: phage/plasmid primase, P4 family [Pseudomonadota bacterium]|jgi:putative DNA primase/helicase